LAQVTKKKLFVSLLLKIFGGKIDIDQRTERYFRVEWWNHVFNVSAAGEL